MFQLIKAGVKNLDSQKHTAKTFVNESPALKEEEVPRVQGASEPLHGYKDDFETWQEEKEVDIYIYIL